MSTNKETKKKTGGGGGCLGCCSANAKPPKATRTGSKGTEAAAPKDAAGATGEHGGKNAEGPAGSQDVNPSDKSLEEENLRGEAIVAGQQMKMGSVDPLARRHTLLLPQQARSGKTAGRADAAALKQALGQQFGIEYDDARSQSHGLVLTPSQHQQLQKIIENSRRRPDGNSNFEENVPLSGRGGINGISTLEVQQALGLGPGVALNLGALLQHHDRVMNQGRASLEGGAEPGRGAAGDREEEYMSGKKTPPRRNEDEAGKGSQQQALALSDIKLNMQSQANPNVSAAGRKGGPAAGDLAHPQGGPSLGQFNTFDPQGQTQNKSSKARASVDRLPNSKNDSKYEGLGGAFPGRVHGHSGPAGDGGARGDAAAYSLNVRPHSNLHVGSAPLAAGAAGGDGSSKATSQVRQSAHFAGSGANSLNSKNSKTSAPSMRDVRIEVDEHAARATAGQVKKTNKPNAASANGTNTIPGSKSGSGGGGRDGEGHCISPMSAAGASGTQGASFGLAAAFHKRNSNPEHPPQIDNRGAKEHDRPKSQLQMNNNGQRIPDTSGKGSRSPLGLVSTSKNQGAGAGLSKAASKVVQVPGQEDFDEVDESEIEYEGEEKAHDKVNQIPNSQVNRNQQGKDVGATSAVQLGGAQNSAPGGAGAARDARSALGGALLSGDPAQPAESPSPHHFLEDMLAGNSSAIQSQNFEHAQQYTMKSLTINNINAGNSSSENHGGMAGFAMSGSVIGSQVNSQGPAGLYYAGPGGQLSGAGSIPHLQRSGAAGLGWIAPSMNFYGHIEGQSPQTVTNNNSKASSSHQNMYELQSQGAIFQAHQLRAGEDILRSQSYQAASSNRKRAMIGENGQISPVSHNSMANFTENDHKFSFGSYAPSHLSSYGAPGPAGHQKGLGQLEVGQIRMSLLNFASSQLQMQNSSGSGGAASRISPQNGQNLVTNSVSSHRPLHERETIEREIRKHSRPGGADPHNNNNGLVTSPKGFGGIQMPIPGRPNLQKVFMLHDIILAPQSQSTQAQLGLIGGGVPALPGLSQKTPTGKQNAADNSLGIIKQKNLETSTVRAKSKEDEIIDTGASGTHDGAGAHHQGLLIELEGKHLTNAANIQENATQSKNSHPTATTAGNSNGGTTASLVGASHRDRGHHPAYYNSADPFMLPIGVVEGFYAPIINEKSQEIDRIRRRVQGHKRERYGCAREFKNQKLLQKQLHEENLNLRKQINLLMIAKLGRKPPVASESSTDASGVSSPTSGVSTSDGKRGGPQAALSSAESKQGTKEEDPRRKGNKQASSRSKPRK